MGRKGRKGGRRELCTLQPVIPCLGVHLCQLSLQMSASPHSLQILISSLIKGVGVSLPGRLHAYSSPSCPDSQHQLNGTWQKLSTQPWEQSNETCEGWLPAWGQSTLFSQVRLLCANLRDSLGSEMEKSTRQLMDGYTNVLHLYSSIVFNHTE